MASAEYNFSESLKTWKEINLSELQKTLDAQGLEIVENQKESMVGRKALADRTKEFRKIPDEEKVTAFKTLLKSYQTEIDSLTRRSKISENAFLSVYKLLAEAPDPYPLLDAAVDQTVKVAEARLLESEVQRLRDENADLRRRTADIATLEAAKKKAESRVEVLEEKMEAAIQDKVTQKENELNATYGEKLLNYEERERDLQRQVALCRSQLRDLQTSNDTSQAKLVDQSQRQDQEVVARLAEVDMIVADLDRANSRVAAVERRNELLRAEIEAVRSGSDSAEKVKALESQVSELQSEAARLLRAYESQKETTADIEQSTKRSSQDAMKVIAAKNEEIETLKQKAKQFSDYDEIKRELEIMKYVEFAGGDDEDAEDLQLPDPNAVKANRQQGQSLEGLLLSKNKKILEELTRFRILHAELEASLQAVTEDLANTRADLEKEKVLNERLEMDLIQVNQHLPKSNGDRISGASSPLGLNNASQDGLSDLNLGHKAQEKAQVAVPFTSSADNSILPIVTSQRDRFRQRNAELEEELRKQFEIISQLRAEIKSLQADNLKLYEKVRYMQSYRDDASGSGSSSHYGGNASSWKSDDMPKYRSIYEERMNPFEAFRGREQARAVQALNPMDKGVFALSRAILGHRRARTLFAVYAIALHILVVVTLYECSSFGPEGTVVQPSPF